MPDLGDITPKFMRSLFQDFSRVKIKRSALSSFLQACIFFSLPCFLIAALSPEPLNYLIFAVGAVPPVLFSVAAIVFLFTDRNRLHTEEHLERMSAIEIVEAKGEGLLLDPVDLVDMVNPAPDPKKLPPETDEEEVSNG